MKFFLFFLFISISLFAQKKWISLEKKEQVNKNYQTDVNLSQLQSVNRLLQGAKIIFPLIDKNNNPKKDNPNSKKNWFIIEKTNID